MSLILSGTDGLSEVDGSAATPAIRGTDANTGIFFPAADTIGFAEGGAEVMRIDSSGNVGIGTSSAGYRLDAQTSTAANTVANIYNSGATSSTLFNNRVLRLATNASGADCTLQFTDSVANNAYIGMASGALNFAPNTGTVAMTLNTVGGLKVLNTVGVGNATPSTSGAGITFPATQSASSNANTLDDYEEGTFSPTFTASTTAPSSVTYDTQSGRYTKIGRVVYVEVYIRITAYSGGSGEARIGNLPFTAAGAPYSGVFFQENTGFSITGTYYSLVTQVGASATFLAIVKQAPNLASTAVNLTEVGSATTVYVLASGCYTTT
jgi:hypothetical protein